MQLRELRAYVKNRRLSLIGEFIGNSHALRQLQAQLHQVAPTDLTALILGETGTGKGLSARTLHQLSECYETWLTMQPDLDGEMDVVFTIVPSEDGQSGKVTEVDVQDSSLDHVFMEGCILRTFEQLQFEAPEDGAVDVTYPLVFARASGDDAQP